MANDPKSNDPEGTAKTTGIAATAANVVHPTVDVRAVTDAQILDRGRLYNEAMYQTRPIVSPGPHARRVAKVIYDGTAHSNGLTKASAERMATSGRSLDSFIKGANPVGKAAEVVAASDYRALHAGQETGIINPPKHVAQNVRDIRLGPDSSSRKDLFFAFNNKNGEAIWKYNGQVKTGEPQYVSDSLAKMAKTPGYGKIGYVDSRYVNPDGTPRVAPDAFTSSQSQRLQKEKVRLRGIPGIKSRADRLNADIEYGEKNGLDPIARQESQQLRDDIIVAYRARGVITRIGGGAAIAGTAAAGASLVMQLATRDEVDLKAIGHAAGTGAISGAGGAAADAGLYHFHTHVRAMAPEAAKESAKQGVAVGFCVLATGIDLISEARSARAGHVTVTDAVSGSAAKTALDFLPLVMAPLGLVGLPVLVGAQIGGRWLIGKAREDDRVVEQAIAADAAHADSLAQQMAESTQTMEDVTADCADTDDLFYEAMGGAPPSARRTMLRLVENETSNQENNT